MENPNLVILINFNTPNRFTRHTLLRRPNTCTSRFNFTDPFNRIYNPANLYRDNIYTLCVSLATFKVLKYYLRLFMFNNY